MPESENVGVTFGVAWPHVARHLGIGNTVKPRAYAAHLGHLLDRLATAFSLRIGPEDDALADMAISSSQPRIASGREQVRFGPIEHLGFVFFPLSRVGALFALGLWARRLRSICSHRFELGDDH